MRSVGLSPVLELCMGVVGATTRLQTNAWSLSVINTLKQLRAMCSDAVCGALVVWQMERASLNVRVHTWAEQLDKWQAISDKRRRGKPLYS